MAQPTAATACSCWPTAGNDQPALLPTPCARDGKGAGHQTASLPTLLRATPDLAQLLPTPRARDGKGTGRDTLPGLLQPQAPSGRLLPTPRASDTGTAGRAAGPGFRPPLSQVLLPHVQQALLLPTPRASDGAKGSPAQRGSTGDLTLPSAAMQLLPTPTAARYGRNKSPSPGAAIRPGLDTIGEFVTAPASDPDRPTSTPGGGWGRYAAAVSRWAAILGRPAPAPTQPGSTRSPVLAPPFVEWLMGLPAGWVTNPSIGLARTAALRVLGNGVVPQQAALALQILLCPHRFPLTP